MTRFDPSKTRAGGDAVTYALSPMQERLLDQPAAAAVVQVVVHVQEVLHVDDLVRSWELILARHPVLRTQFVTANLPRPRQRVLPQVSLPVKRLDWRRLPGLVQEAELAAFLVLDRGCPLSPEAAPLLRLTVIRCGDEAGVMVFSHHAALLDDLSRLQVLRDVFTLYDAICAGRRAQLAPATEFQAYLQWLAGLPAEAAATFWRERLRDAVVSAPWRWSAVRSDSGHGYERVRCPSTLDVLAATAQHHHVATEVLLLAAWALVVSRYGGGREVLFGRVKSIRRWPRGGGDDVGVYTNALPLRVPVAADMALRDWLQIIAAAAAEQGEFEHASPAVMLAGDTGTSVASGWGGLASVVVQEDVPSSGGLGTPGGPGGNRRYTVYQERPYPLAVSLAVTGSCAELVLEYDRGSVAATVAKALLGHAQAALAAIAAALPETPLHELNVLSADDLLHVLVNRQPAAARAAGLLALLPAPPSGDWSAQAAELPMTSVQQLTRGWAATGTNRILCSGRVWQVLATELAAGELPARLDAVGIVGPDVDWSALQAWRQRVPAGVRLLRVFPFTDAGQVVALADLAAWDVPEDVPLGWVSDGSHPLVLDPELQLMPPGATGELYLALPSAANVPAAVPLTPWNPQPHVQRLRDAGLLLPAWLLTGVMPLRRTGLRVWQADSGMLFLDRRATPVAPGASVSPRGGRAASLSSERRSCRPNDHEPPAANDGMMPSAPSIPSLSPDERLLLAIWRDVLGNPHIGLEDAAAGPAVTALDRVVLLTRVERKFGCALDGDELYRAGTLAGLSQVLRRKAPRVAARAVVPVQALGARPPLFIAWPGELPPSLLGALGDDQPVFLLNPLDDMELAAGAAAQGVVAVAARLVEDINAVQPAGPCAVCGCGLDAALAYEVSRQLAAGGNRELFVALVDPDTEVVGPFALVQQPWRNLGEFGLSHLQAGFWRQVRRLTGLAEGLATELSTLTHHMTRTPPPDFLRVSLNRTVWDWELATYAWTRYSGSVALLAPRDRHLTRAPRLQRLAAGGLEIVELPGPSYQLGSPELSAATGRLLRATMDRWMATTAARCAA